MSAASMPERISLCDVTAVPSLTTASWKEQFGRSVVESMACGVPVVASDSGSLPEVIGGAGLVVPEKSSSALAKVLQRLAQNPDERCEFSIRGRTLVKAEYTWKKVAESTIEFYREALRIQKQRQK